MAFPPTSWRGRCDGERRPHTLKNNLLQSVWVAETLGGVQNLETDQAPLLVVLAGDAFRQFLCRDRGVPEQDAEGVHLGVIADAHCKLPSEEIRVYRHHDDFRRFLDEDRPHTLERVGSPVPYGIVRKLLRGFPPTGAARTPVGGTD